MLSQQMQDATSGSRWGLALEGVEPLSQRRYTLCLRLASPEIPSACPPHASVESGCLQHCLLCKDGNTSAAHADYRSDLALDLT